MPEKERDNGAIKQETPFKTINIFAFKKNRQSIEEFKTFYMDGQAGRILMFCTGMLVFSIISIIVLLPRAYRYGIQEDFAGKLYTASAMVFGMGILLAIVGNVDKFIRRKPKVRLYYFDVLTNVLVTLVWCWGTYSIYLSIVFDGKPDYLIWAMALLSTGCFFYTDPLAIIIISVINFIATLGVIPLVTGYSFDYMSIYNMIIFEAMVFFWLSMKYHMGIRGLAGQKRLAQAQKSKEEFLASVTHEMRSPLNAVLVKNELLLRETEDEEVRRVSSEIQSYGKILNSLINDILDIAKIDAGSMKIVPAPYKTKTLIKDLYGMVSPTAEAKKLALVLDVSDKVPKVLRGDAVRIQQVILNLLTNAIKYTKQGCVTFKVDFERTEPIAGILTVSVKDTGIGIKEEDIPNITARFERFDEISNRGIQGTGLGLSITSNLLQMMGSKLEIESQYGAGSKFYFSIRQEILDTNPIEMEE